MTLIDEAVTAASRHHHTALLPFALFWRARVLGAIGDLERGLADIEEAISISRAQGHRPAVAHCLGVAGGLLLAAGDDDAAAARFDESLAIHLETGDHWGIARVLEDLAILARAGGSQYRASGRVSRRRRADARRDRDAARGRSSGEAIGGRHRRVPRAARRRTTSSGPASRGGSLELEELARCSRVSWSAVDGARGRAAPQAGG